MAEEITLLVDDVATVTSARVVLRGVTYAMSNITSVSLQTQLPDNTLIDAFIGANVIVGGLALLFGGVPVAIICAILIGCLILAKKQKTTNYKVRLATAAGEVDAFTDDDKARIEKIVTAISDAIVHRG